MADDHAKAEHFEFIKAPDFENVYSNHAVFSTGPWDFSFICGEIIEVDKVKQIAKVEQRVRVAMPPLQAKIFAMALNQQLKAYEDAYGKIVIPPGMLVETGKPPQQEAPKQSPEGPEK